MQRTKNLKEKRNIAFAAILSALLMLMLIGSACGDPAEKAENSKELSWITDMEAAKKKAALEGKDLLIDFTGSDWCGWCIKLVDEVYSKDAFIKAAPEKFIFVELDFPRDKSNLTTDTMNANNALKEKYGVTGFPTIFLADAKGIPYAQTGYQAGGPEKYLEHLTLLSENKVKKNKLLAQAAKATGLEKARLLDEAMDIAPGLSMKFHTDVIDEIIALDAEDKAKLKSKYAIQRALANVTAALAKKDSKQAIELLDAIIAEYKPTAELLQTILFVRSEAQFYLKDMEGLRVTLDKALAAAPESEMATQIKSMIERFSPDEKEADVKDKE